MINNKHNKKRNTGLLYEILLKNLAECVVSGNGKRRETVISIIKEFFHKGTELSKELSIYKEFETLPEVSEDQRVRFFEDIQRKKALLDDTRLQKEKSSAISKINKALGKSVFSAFIPNYKNLATIYQLLNVSNFNSRLVVERILSEDLAKKIDNEEMKTIDELTFKTFTKKFNEKYSKSSLLSEQKRLLSAYIMSIADGQLELKTFLNEEIGRLKECMREGLKIDEIQSDELMVESANKIYELLDNFGKNKPEIDKKMVETVLKIQELVSKELSE